MTPEEKAAALAEAKGRGLPDGWRVELDVSPSHNEILHVWKCSIITFKLILIPFSCFSSISTNCRFSSTRQFRRRQKSARISSFISSDRMFVATISMDVIVVRRC